MNEIYKDIGSRLKGCAAFIFVLEVIGVAIGGIALIAEDVNLAGWSLLIGGPVVALIFSWLLYAFGELVEKTVQNEENTRHILRILRDREGNPSQWESTDERKAPTQKTAPYSERTAVAANRNKERATHEWRCDGCGNMRSQTPCEHCGQDENAKKKAPYRCGKCGRNGPYEDNCPSCGSSIKLFYNI